MVKNAKNDIVEAVTHRSQREESWRAKAAKDVEQYLGPKDVSLTGSCNALQRWIYLVWERKKPGDRSCIIHSVTCIDYGLLHRHCGQ